MLSLLAMLWVPNALALGCGDITKMLDANVPAKFVVQTIQESGSKLSAEDVRCLVKAGAPEDVVAAARGSGTAAAAPASSAPATDAAAKPAAKSASKSEQARAAYDSTEALGGSRSGARGGKRSLEDQAGTEEEAADTRDPDKLEQAIRAYQSKKPLQSSQLLRELLKEGAFPQKEGRIQYYLGASLFDLGLYHSAQYYFIEVVKKGPSNPNFKFALPKLVEIARYTGDDYDLARIVAKVPVEEFPRQARDELYYLLGVRLYEQDKLSDARKAFGQVSERSPRFTRAKYFEGVIFNKQGKLKSAVKSFTEVAKADVEAANPRELAAFNQLRELSLLNIARVYYGIQRFDEAKSYYEMVPRESIYWPESLFEGAWTNFMLSDLNLSLGQLLTLRSPFYGNDEFVPETKVLQALTFFNLCEYGDVDRILNEFDGTYRPMNQELMDVVKQYSSEEGKKLADQAYLRYFGANPRETLLPRAMFSRILRNQELAGLVTHLELMEREQELIRQQKATWKDSVGEELNRVIEQDRERLTRRAGLAMLREMTTLSNYLKNLTGQVDIIRFEVVDARRVDYTYKMQNVDLNDTSSRLQVDFATSADRIYWPFNGEFWKDELGYYYYAEQGNCR
ncbi:MAG: hypothetical protein RLZZ299_1002 [Pseudomonadota bacterium]